MLSYTLKFSFSDMQERFTNAKILGPERYARLFKEHIRTLTFQTGEYGYRLYDPANLPNQDLAEEAKRINPFYGVEHQKKLKDDYYTIMLEKVKEYAFLPLYQVKLSQIAQEEMKLNGPRLETEYYRTRADFDELITRLALLELSPLAQENKESLLSLPKEEQEAIAQTLELISFYHLDKDLELNLSEMEVPQFQHALLERVGIFLNKLFELENSQSESFGVFDAPTIKALAIYYRKRCKEDPEMARVFQQTIQAAVAGNYEQWRSWGVEQELTIQDKVELLDRMKQDKLLPGNLTLGQYEQWVQTDTATADEALGYELADIRLGINDILSQAVIDNHIQPESLSLDPLLVNARYEEIIEPLREWTKQQQALKEKGKRLTGPESEEFEHLKQTIHEYRTANRQQLLELEALRYIDRVKQLTFNELQSQSLFLGGKAVAFTKMTHTIEDAFKEKYPEFTQDVRRIQQLLEESRGKLIGSENITKSALSITDKVDVKTAILIGEKPVPSCQHYAGSSLNTGLLSYLADPSLKIIQVQDDEGRIIARSILRIMEDDTRTPQLFMERVYSVNPHHKIHDLVQKFAQDKANTMGVTLFSQKGEKEPKSLHSSKSRSPYVYTDAGGGKKRDGIFTVRRAYEV